MIPQGWQPIGEPNVPELSPDALRVKSYIMKHGLTKINLKTIESIGRALCMGFDRVQDSVYEIRKQEAIIIMARNPKIIKEQRAEMLRLHNEERYSVGKLANKYGCSQTAVKTALQAAKIEADDANESIIPKMPQSADMDTTEELHEMSANAEESAAITENSAAIAEPEQAKLPPVVLRAIRYSLSDMESEIEAREEHIAELKIEIEEFRKDIAALKAWREAHA